MPEIDALKTALAERYVIERELGSGGMATVYLAQDRKHDRKVALKVLKPELAAVLGAERFVAEIKTTAALQHPHILPLFDSGTAAGFLFYVMPFIDGETLRSRLDRERQLGIDEAVRITTEVADALQYAHEHGVIHRDIKPENILLANGRPMVADFGIAIAVSAAAGGRMTETGLSLGTPHYMSPEQATAEKEISARSDVYSLASVLYEMLAGQPPHLGGSAQQIIMKIIAEPVQPVTALRKSVPPNVAAALAMALEKLPADRIASAREFAAALNNPTFAAHAGAGGVTAMSRAARRLVWMPAVVAALTTAALIVVLTRRKSTVPERPERFVVAQLTEDAQADGGLGISADGNAIAFLAARGGVTRVYRRSLADIDATAVPGTDGAVEIAVSPDGRSVAFEGADDNLTIVPLDGGRSRTVIKTTTPAGMSWSARHGLVLGMPAFSHEIWGLTLVPEAGDSSLTVLTRPGPTSMNHDPHVLDDGETVLYLDIRVRQKELPAASRVTTYLGSGTITGKNWITTTLPVDEIVGVADGILVYIDGGVLMAVRFDGKSRRPVGEPVRIDHTPAGVREAAMSGDGTLVMRVRSDQYQLALVNDTGEGPAVSADTIDYLYPRFSPDGTRAALSMPVRGSDDGVWILVVSDKTRSRLGFAASNGLDWTRNGKRVVSAGRSVTWQAADRSDSVSALARIPGKHLWGLTVSPDGSAVVMVTGYGPGGFDLVMRRTSGDTTTIPLVATSANEYAPRFSPDGRWLAYTSDESGRPEVYVQPFPGPGTRVQISTDGGNQAVWSGDSRHIYYRVGNAFLVADVAASKPPGALEVTARRKLFEGSYYGSDATETSATYDVTPDGRNFLVARALGNSVGEIVAWTGWLQELQAQLKQQH